VKLLYAVAFAFFPLAAPAQTLDSSLLTALCHDDYFEDTAGQCRAMSAGEIQTIEAISIAAPASSSLQKIRLSSDGANQLNGSRNWWADGDG
jgi:hypothetical protein